MRTLFKFQRLLNTLSNAVQCIWCSTTVVCSVLLYIHVQLQIVYTWNDNNCSHLF